MIVRADFKTTSEPAYTRIVTMRDKPSVILITPSISLNDSTPDIARSSYERGGVLSLSHPNITGKVDVSFPVSGESIPFEVFGDPVQVVDCGEAAAEWLSQLCGEPVRLVVHGQHFVAKSDVLNSLLDTTSSSDYASCAPRISTNTYGDDLSNMPAVAKKVTAAFADAYPFLLVSTGSMKDLNDHLAERLTQGKGDLKEVRAINFRPNIVIDNEKPFEEDEWMTVAIGSGDAPKTVVHVLSRATRCVATTVDPDTAQKTKDPLTTLMAYRRVEPNAKYEVGQRYMIDECALPCLTGAFVQACFGMWGVHDFVDGVVRKIAVGDDIEVLKLGQHGKASKKK
ncbi:hypothetical protein HDU93_008338 [Gonapodya sp. JEL0774]|nr:hypothetical protein HDU93_008338 [Gonapodya sp. JEL0774]